MKKILIITIILLCFLFVGVVSAAPTQNVYVAVNGNDTSNTGTNVNSPYATIAKGVSVANDSSATTIHLSAGTFTGNGNVGVDINKAHRSQGGNLIIIGDGYNKTFIDANSMNNVFSIQADSVVRLINITFINGRVANGGTILNTGGLTIDNCIFERNYASTSGGVIRSSGGNLTISNSIFNNNSAGGSSGYGGAIYATATTTSISNSSFTNNFATNAGAVALNSGIIRNSYFANNYAKTSNGGSISISGSLINNTIINSTITATTGSTAGRGGAVYLSSGTNYLYNNTMTNCSAINGNYIYLAGNVNAIVTYSDVTVTTSSGTLTATVTDDMGHPISTDRSIVFYANDILLGSTVATSVVDGTATRNYTKMLYNGLYTINGVSSYFNNMSIIKNGTLTVNLNDTMINQYVSNSGSDDTGDGSQSNPYKTIQKAINAGFEKGYYVTVHLLDQTYSGNGNTNITVTKDGFLGLIGVSNKSIIDGGNVNWGFSTGANTFVNITNTTFNNLNGTNGAVYAAYDLFVDKCIVNNSRIISVTGGRLIVQNSAFTNNTGVSGTVTVTNCSFINNDNVNAIYGGDIIVSNSTFTNCTADRYGGAIYAQGSVISTNNWYISNSVINLDSGSSFGAGGAIYCTSGNILSTNDTFIGNYASKQGGAIYIMGGNLTVINGTFSNNSAGIDGGAIYSYGYSNMVWVSLINNTMTFNNAVDNGNDIYLYGNSLITKSNLTFVNNSTIHINKITGTVTATVTDDNGNCVSGGYVDFYLGGKYIGSAPLINGIATLTYSGFVNGTYNLSGKHSLAGNYTVNIKNGTVVADISEISSVDYYVSNSGSDVTGNGSKTNPFLTIQKALTAGLESSRNITIHLLEGVYSGVGNINITLPGVMNITIIGDGLNKTIIDGQSTTNWIFNMTMGDGLITLDGLSIINFKSTTVSPITIADVNVKILNSYFGNNTAISGGAIYNQGKLIVNNSIFNGNQALSNVNGNYGGGAIFNTGTLIIDNTSIINNKATTGSGIFNGGNLTITNSLIANSTKTTWSNSGSAIFGGNVSVVNCTFYNTTTSAQPGTNYDISGTTFLEIYNSTFYKSLGIGSLAKIYNSVFANMSMGLNGEFYNLTFLNITMSVIGEFYDSTFKNCTITSSSDTKFYNSIFTNMNRAITVNGGNLLVVGCLFTNNTYAIYGSGADNVTISNSVILNPIQITASNLTADYNWWGSNSKPSIGAADVNYWIIMTLTSVNKPGLSRNIVLAFNSTDGGNVYGFDGYLPVRDYLFGVSNGSISPVSGSLIGNIINAVFNVGGYGSYLVNVTVDNQTLSIPLTLFRANSTTTVGLSNSTGKRGNTITITVEVKDENGDLVDGGEVEFFIGNTSIGKVQVVDGIAVMNWLVDRDTGEYEINARYLGTDSYVESDDGKLYLVDNVVPSVSTTRNGGSFKGAQNVTLICDDPTAIIYYTTDGSTPTMNSAKYLGPIRVTGSMLLRYFALDPVGNPSQIYTQSYIVDMVAPVVNKVDPAKNAVVKSAKTIKVTFSEPVKAGSKVWVDLKNSTGTLLKVTSTIMGNTLTIIPSKALGNGRYSLFIHTGAVTDMVGNALVSYTGAFSVDAVAPKVSKVDPRNGATKIAVSKTIKVTFNEVIKAGSKVWVELKNSNNKAIAFKYSISGKVLTIDPKSKLVESLYTLIIHTGTVTDLAGNPVASKSYKFSVGTAPKVSKVDPRNGVTKVVRSKTIKVTFNENIKAASGSKYWVELKTSNGKSVKISKSIKGKVLSISHARLAANTKYQLIIHSGAVTDKAGNPIVAKTYKFTTGKT